MALFSLPAGRKLGIEEAGRLGLVGRRVPAGQDGQAVLELASQKHKSAWPG